MFGHEGGGGGGSPVETIERTTSVSHLDAREVVVMAGLSKQMKEPPLSRIWM